MDQRDDFWAAGRHPVNVTHLVLGLAFLGIVAVWAVVQGDLVDGDDVRWLLPVPWVVAGVAGLLATTLGARSTRRSRPSRPAPEQRHEPAGTGPADR